MIVSNKIFLSDSVSAAEGSSRMSIFEGDIHAFANSTSCFCAKPSWLTVFCGSMSILSLSNSIWQS